jgi:nucleotide-binding universal stress UspA family protein
MISPAPMRDAHPATSPTTDVAPWQGLRAIKSQVLDHAYLSGGRKERAMYDRILVPVDGSPTSDHGLQEAIRIAKLTKGRLRLMHVIDELSLIYAGNQLSSMPTLREDAARLLDNDKRIAEAEGLEAETVLKDIFKGRVHELILTEARNWPADLIVLGTHGRRGIDRLTMGSSAENILRQATVPVLLVRGVKASP